MGAYAVSKTALLGINEIAAATLVSDGIRVNCIAPGVVKTKFAQLVRTATFFIDNLIAQWCKHMYIFYLCH